MNNSFNKHKPQEKSSIIFKKKKKQKRSGDPERSRGLRQKTVSTIQLAAFNHHLGSITGTSNAVKYITFPFRCQEGTQAICPLC